MRRVKQLLDLPHGDAVGAAIGKAEPGSVSGALARRSEAGGPWRVVVWGEGCAIDSEVEAADALDTGHGPVLAWRQPRLPTVRRSGPAAGRTQRALDLIDTTPGLTPHAASIQAGVDASAVYRALARRKRHLCTCCGRPLPYDARV
jgi:hypothetical protein